MTDRFEKLRAAYVERYEERHRGSVELEFEELFREIAAEIWEDGYATAEGVQAAETERRMARMSVAAHPHLTRAEKRRRLQEIDGRYLNPDDPTLEERVALLEKEAHRD